MPLLVNIRDLQKESAHLEGEIPVGEFAADFKDELVRFVEPLSYDLEVDRQGSELTVVGRLETEIECDCGRCLKTFRQPLVVEDFASLVPLEGEEAVAVKDDFADLTPYLREDTFLALPTNPLCTPDCRGLVPKAPDRDLRLGEGSPVGPTDGVSPWDALKKLKL
ncbi:MAG: hypothetical protein DVB31_00950 [Verrucomicrobia bacterium]|nr:MAG: hypothetical protein DVB31_00950 [Verrucomicrobiota bacterium]